jgi:hypothetical protein
MLLLLGGVEREKKRGPACGLVGVSLVAGGDGGVRELFVKEEGERGGCVSFIRGARGRAY